MMIGGAQEVAKVGGRGGSKRNTAWEGAIVHNRKQVRVIVQGNEGTKMAKSLATRNLPT